MRDEYRVTVKVRNNYLLNAMEAVGVNGSQMSNQTGVSLFAIYQYLGLKRTPVDHKTGEFRDDIYIIASFLGASVYDLFPEAHLTKALKKNSVDTTMSADAMNLMIGCYEQSTPEDNLMLAERDNIINQMVGQLSPREITVIKSRFFDEKTLLETGELIGGISLERTRQIENKALRKLAHPSKRAKLAYEVMH